MGVSIMNSYFPVGCSDRLSHVGLLVKARRLALGLRQSDLKTSLGISAHMLRKIESGSEAVDMRSFMLVLWRLGITDTLFVPLDGIEQASEITLHAAEENKRESIARRRVRLAKPKPEDFS